MALSDVRLEREFNKKTKMFIREFAIKNIKRVTTNADGSREVVFFDGGKCKIKGALVEQWGVLEYSCDRIPGIFY